MEEFKEQVKKSFIACKSDISLLKHENDRLREEVENLKVENSNLKENFEKQKELIDELKTQIKAFEIALNFIKDISPKINQNNYSSSQNNFEENNNLNKEKKLKKNIQANQPQDPYSALLAYKAKINKKETLKKKIISLIKENGIPQNELKFMFVDHYKYCSKATFYNYLKELEMEGKIKIERINSKNIVLITENIKKEMFL